MPVLVNGGGEAVKEGEVAGALGCRRRPPPPTPPAPQRPAHTAVAAAVATCISGEDSPATQTQRQVLLAMKLGNNIEDASSDHHCWRVGDNNSTSTRTCQ